MLLIRFLLWLIRSSQLCWPIFLAVVRALTSVALPNVPVQISVPGRTDIGSLIDLIGSALPAASATGAV